MEPTQLFQHFIRRPASACAAGAGVLALLAWWCLLFGDAASRSGQTTMDPATAGSMMLLSLGLFLFNRHRSSPAVRRFALFAAFGVAAVSLYFGLQFIFGFDLTAKNLAPFSSPANNILSHRMSPLSAAAFLSAAVAFCLELLPPDRRRIYRQTATLSALAVFLSGSLVIIKYALGMPVISDIHNHPMTLMEAISFALLGLGIVILSRFDFLDRDIAECDRIEGELRQSVERQQLFCEQSSLAIIEWDQIFRVTQWNPTAERMFGYKAEEAVGQFVTFLVSPDAQEDAKRLLMNLTVKQYAVSNTNNIRTKDGRTIVCRWNNTPLTGSDGKFLGAVSLCEEITEHKRTEEQLERLAAVIHNCSELVAISTLKGETVFLNEPGCEMLGIDPSNAQRHSYLEFVSGFYRKEVERKIVPALLRGKTWKGELQYRNLKTGKPVDVQATFFVIREPVSGNPLYYANISLDITERKRAEASLHEKDRKLQLFAENVSDLIWSINFAAKATYISPSVKQFLGYEPAEFSRFTFKDYMTPDSAQYALSRLEKAIAEHRPGHLLKPDTFELECRRKDGTTVWTEIQTNGAYDEKGELVGIQGITRDIGNRKQADEMLKQSERRHRLFAENVNAILWEMDFSGVYTYVSPTVKKQLGYSREEAMQFKLGQTMTAESAASVRQCLAGVVEDVRSGRPLPDGYFEAEHYRKDGSRLWTGVRYSARCDEAGKPIGVQGITIDIGEQKRIQAELAFKNVLLRTQQEVSLDGILAVDADNKVILRNQRFNEMWYLPSGISDTEDDNAVLHTVMDLVADPEAFLERVLYLYSQRQEKSRDEILMKDGRVFDRYSAPMIGPDGQYFGRVWYFRDITEHKEADEMLRKSEERYRKLFENLAQENPQAFESMLKSH